MTSLEELPARKAPFAVLDFETTGLAAAYGHRVCEVAILTGRNNEIGNRYQTLINPQRSIPESTQRVHGISIGDVRDAPTFEEVADRLLEMLQDRVLVAHNARFDLTFLETELNIINCTRDRSPVVDSCLLARKNFDFPSNSLNALARRIGLPVQEHRALADVEYTWQVLNDLIKKLPDGMDTTISTLMQLQGGPVEVIIDEGHEELAPVYASAIREGTPLRIEYRSSGGGITQRVIDPMHSQIKDGFLYLVGYCRLREDQRSFRVDRIRQAEIAEQM